MKTSIPSDKNTRTDTSPVSTGTRVRPTSCQEVEVRGRDTGSLGGVGKHCTSIATQFCTTCSKMLCDAHYAQIHSVHDVFGTSKGQSAANY
jgi:hypothetical protein